MENHTFSTILGAGGSIGNALVPLLLADKKHIRLVSRRGLPVEGAESVKADLTSVKETTAAVVGSDVVYLCAGIQYSAKIWAETWPKIMSSAIEACKSARAKLIFLDNVYSYGRVDGPMTEETPYNPCSKKGEVRVKIAQQLQGEMKKGSLDAIIARAADFYGPYAMANSIPQVLVVSRLMKGQKAYWLVNAGALHNYSYTIDVAKGLQLLAGDPSAFGQVWHLPTPPPIKGTEFIELAARALNVEPRFMVMRKWMIKLAGLTDATLREIYEMLYQNEFDYNFDSSKFNKYFNYIPVSYNDGILQTINILKEQKP